MKEVTMEPDNNEPVANNQLTQALQQVVDSTDANELGLAKSKLSIVLDALGS